MLRYVHRSNSNDIIMPSQKKNNRLLWKEEQRERQKHAEN